MEVKAHSGQELAVQSKKGLEWVWRGSGSRAGQAGGAEGLRLRYS